MIKEIFNTHLQLHSNGTYILISVFEELLDHESIAFFPQ